MNDLEQAKNVAAWIYAYPSLESITEDNSELLEWFINGHKNGYAKWLTEKLTDTLVKNG